MLCARARVCVCACVQALLRYQSVTDKQFETEMRDSYLMSHNQTGQAVSGANEYGKPGQDENAHVVAQLLPPLLTSVWAKMKAEPELHADDEQGKEDEGSVNSAQGAGGLVSELWLEVVFPTALHEDYGAPSSAWLRHTFNATATGSVGIELELYNKTATRIGEAGWLSFTPSLGQQQQQQQTHERQPSESLAAGGLKYEVDKLGSW